MSNIFLSVAPRLAGFIAVPLLVGVAAVAYGQFTGGGLFGNRVGGVSIDTKGVVSPAEQERRIPQRDALRKLHPAPAAELNQPTEMRMISLRRLEEAVKSLKETTAENLPDELRFLAGIQRLQYVLVYPEEHDVVLAGPGEGWKVDEEGNVVGVTTGRPVIPLEDLIVAFRTVDNARRGGISCSIDPTAEGRKRLEELPPRRSGSTAAQLAAMRKAWDRSKSRLLASRPTAISLACWWPAIFT